jgi:Fe-S-cluster containining protein
LSRIPLRVIKEEKTPLVECLDCGQCCTYVGISIDAPSRPRWATDILWHLYHPKTYVYLDGNGEWSMHFESRCNNLGPDNRCGIYAVRPHICRAHDNRTCEVNDHSCQATTFRDPVHFLQWLAAHKPNVYLKIKDTHVPAALRAQVPEPEPAKAAQRTTAKQARRASAADRASRSKPRGAAEGQAAGPGTGRAPLRRASSVGPRAGSTR